MSIWHTLGLCLALFGSAVLLTGAGAVVLRLLGVKPEHAGEALLYAVALGVVFLDLAVSLAKLAPNLRLGVRVAIAMVALTGLSGLKDVLIFARLIARKIGSLSGITRLHAGALLLVLVLEGLASFAPLTGSDALHYHFTMPALYWNQGFHADWSLLHGFFCGLSHEFILAGIALGSSQLAQGWLFLGGAVGALATLRLVQSWVGGVWPWLSALAFALTPVVFWQATAAGAPDIWMCAFVPLSLLAILRARANPSSSYAALAGILAGATAG